MTAAMSAIISTPSGDCGYYQFFGTPSEDNDYYEDVRALYSLCAYDSHRCQHQGFYDRAKKSAIVSLLESSSYLMISRSSSGEYPQLMGNIFLFCSTVEEADVLCEILMYDPRTDSAEPGMEKIIDSMCFLEDGLRHLDKEIADSRSIIHREDVAIEIRAEFMKSAIPLPGEGGDQEWNLPI